jgi:hypothetical protein
MDVLADSIKTAESLQNLFAMIYFLVAWAFGMVSPFLVYEIWKSCKEERPFNFNGADYWCPIAIVLLVISSALVMLSFFFMFAKTLLRLFNCLF